MTYERADVVYRRPRQLWPGYLAWLRTLPCAASGQPAPCDAAHLKAGSLKHNKPWAGSAKPDDSWALPLKHGLHMRQHDYGDELGWWQAQGVKDPFQLAIAYNSEYRRLHPNAPEPYVRRLRSIKPRKPREQRTKIKSRNDLRRRK